ncbi:MAG: hypothetical protein CEE43_16710 [Promethearchaeota archaeon Loki_b32]|nr:MAG: hypothetical protein CEE43_16710 [Candidatus Lokiarchaeota archaeon Loki_b32]
MVKENNKTMYFKDISFSESFEIYEIKALVDELFSLDSLPDDSWSCTCPQWASGQQECIHIKQYKQHNFDPTWLPDFPDYNDPYIDVDLVKLGKKGGTFKNFVEEYPRWVIEFILKNNLEMGYTKMELAKSLRTTDFKIGKLLWLLGDYHQQVNQMMNKRILSIIDENKAEELIFWDSQILSLPESIGNFTSVRKIDLSGNKLTGLPDSIGDLPLLEILNLNNNSIEKIPKSLGNLKNLKELHLVNNRLTTLPNSVGNLASLEILDLSWNYMLGYLGESIFKLPRLKKLILENTPLEKSKYKSIEELIDSHK